MAFHYPILGSSTSISIGEIVAGSSANEFLITDASGKLANQILNVDGVTITGDGIINPLVATTSGVTIGAPVSGGTPSLVLYVDDSGNLGQNSNFNFDPIAGTYNVAAGSSAFAQDGTTGTTTILSEGIQQLSVSDSTGLQQFGDIGGDWAFDLLKIDGPNRKITLQDSGAIYLSIDNIARQYSLGDLSGAGNTTTFQVDDNAQFITLNSRTTLTAHGIIESGIQNPAYGTTTTIATFDGTYHLAFHTGSGATTVNLPASGATPMGTKFVFSDGDRLFGSGSALTVNASGFDIINTKTTSGGSYTNSINGASFELVNIYSGVWQLTATN